MKIHTAHKVGALSLRTHTTLVLDTTRGMNGAQLVRGVVEIQIPLLKAVRNTGDKKRRIRGANSATIITSCCIDERKTKTTT